MTLGDTDFAVIASLDLDPIKVKLMHKESGEGWSLEQANAVEFEYRRFLYLMKKFPEEGAAPRTDVDIFWHYHILDTSKYARDCQAVFGYFLHHFPYVGLRGGDDMALHHRAGERMRELYEETFGESFIPGAVASKAASPGSLTAYSFVPSGDAASSRPAMTMAYSYVPPNSAPQGKMTDTAYSYTPPANAALQNKMGTAYSFVPSTSGATADTAYSFVPQGGKADAGFSHYDSQVRPTLAMAMASC